MSAPIPHAERIARLKTLTREYDASTGDIYAIRAAREALRNERLLTFPAGRLDMIDRLVDLAVDDHLEMHELPGAAEIAEEWPVTGGNYLDELRDELTLGFLDAYYGDTLSLAQWVPDAGDERAEQDEQHRGRAEDEQYELMRDRRDGRG